MCIEEVVVMVLKDVVELVECIEVRVVVVKVIFVVMVNDLVFC